VDGALLLTQQLDIVGFGVEIQATQVYRPLAMNAA